VLHQVDDSELARLTSFGIDLEKASGRAHHAIAVPAAFLVDRKGVVRWAHADPGYKVRPSTAQILGAIDGLSLEKP
jgi:peroxiredoxin